MASFFDNNSMKGKTEAIPATSKNPRKSIAKNNKLNLSLSVLLSMLTIFLMSIEF
jgi:hypothetical protein